MAEYSIWIRIFTTTTYLHQEEMNAKCGQSSGQFNVFDLRVHLGGSHQVLVLLEDLLFYFVGPDVGLGQKLFQAARRTKRFFS